MMDMSALDIANLTSLDSLIYFYENYLFEYEINDGFIVGIY